MTPQKVNLNPGTGPHSCPVVCPYCNWHPKNWLSLSIHCAKLHDTERESLTKKLFFNDVRPLCATAGCNSEVLWISLEQGYRKFCKKCIKLICVNHLAVERRKNYKPAWNNGLTKYDHEGIARGTEKLKQAIEKNGMWCQGLTKETDERVAKMSAKAKATIKQRYASGILVPWGLGKTKITDERIALRGRQISKTNREKGHWSTRCSASLYECWRTSISKTRRDNFEIGTIKNHTVLTFNDAISRLNNNENWAFVSCDEQTLQNTKAMLRENCNISCRACGLHTTLTFGQIFNDVKCRCKRWSKESRTFEKEVYDFVESIIPDPIRSDRTIIKPKELDIVVMSQQFAIECNGLYWHSSSIKELPYTCHQDKTDLAGRSSVSLYHLYEDEWSNKREIVESYLRHRLGYSKRKISARKCTVVFEEPGDVKSWFQQNHVDGFVTCDFALNLKFDDEILGSFLCSLKDKGIEITRFAFQKNTHVYGGFSKLILRLKQYCIENSIEKVQLNIDMRFGGLSYESFGFVLKGMTDPLCWYTDHHSRTVEETENTKALISGCRLRLYELNLTKSWQKSSHLK